jgi:UDP-2-acetamido-2,6-beta-L-arabino-hexul-4-ose reductase
MTENIIKVGITGNKGFIGSHLHNYLDLQNNIELVPFQNSFFDNHKLLNDFVSSCDTIVHLAAVNRHDDDKIL